MFRPTRHCHGDHNLLRAAGKHHTKVITSISLRMSGAALYPHESYVRLQPCTEVNSINKISIKLEDTLCLNIVLTLYIAVGTNLFLNPFPARSSAESDSADYYFTKIILLKDTDDCLSLNRAK